MGNELQSERDERGRFLPGSSGGPGRPSRRREEELLQAIKAAFPPEVLTEKLQRALEMAEAQQSPRGMVAVLSFAAAYSLGKPTQRIETDRGEERLALLMELLNTPRGAPGENADDAAE